MVGGGESGSSSWRRDCLENEPRGDASFPLLFATFPAPAMGSSQVRQDIGKLNNGAKGEMKERRPLY